MPEKLKMQSGDIVQENIEKVGALFPNCITEIVKDGKTNQIVDFESLKLELSRDDVDSIKERYQFTWPEKTKARVLANTPVKMALRPCRGESVDFDNTKNLYIEGDNLDVLRVLRETYLGKIKMIYIDPPYNTGNDFVYDDDYSQDVEEYKKVSGDIDNEGNRLFVNSSSNGRFHTDWLNMIHPRIKIARDLLAEDGIIAISIDDHELCNLLKICNELFNEKNMLSNCIWISGRTSSSHFTNSHEYVVIYAKNKDALPLFAYDGEPVTISDRAIKKAGVKNPPSEITFPAGIEFRGENKVFPARFGDSEVIEVTKGIFECHDGKLKSDVTLKAGWTMKDMILSWLRGDKVIDQKGQIVTNFFFKENGVLQYEKIKGTMHPNSVITDITTKSGTTELERIFDGVCYFPYPKPVELIKYFKPLMQSKDNDSIIMDFFSGSATTAQAIMELNAEDGGNRKFIMVQYPEPIKEDDKAYEDGYKNICEIGKERIRRAGKQTIDRVQSKLPNYQNNVDVGFRVLKLDSTNMKNVYYSPSETSKTTLDGFKDNIKSDRTHEDLLFQVMLDLNIELSVSVERIVIAGREVFSVDNGYLMACFMENISNDVVTEIANRHPYYFVLRDSSMMSDSVATNFDQIFKAYSPDTIRSVL